MRLLLALALAGSTAACTTWPPSVGGGMAQLAGPPPGSLGYATPVGQHLTCSLQAVTTVLQVAEQTGHETGRADLLRVTALRAAREFAGQLPNDAARTLVRLDRHTRALEGALHLLPLDPRHCST